MNNWLQSLTESYQVLREEQQFQHNLEILAEDIHKDNPSLSEQQVYNVLINALHEMLAPANWAEIHGTEAGQTRRGRKDKVAQIAKAAAAAVTPAGSGVWGALKRTFSGKEKRLQILSQHHPDFLARQLVLKPEERHESLRGMKDEHIRQHIENHAKLAQASQLHAQLGGEHDFVVPEAGVRQFQKATNLPAHQAPLPATARNTQGSRAGYEQTPKDMGRGEVDREGRPVYRDEFGTGKPVDTTAPFPRVGWERGSLDTQGELITGDKTNPDAHVARGIKLTMRRGGTINTSGIEQKTGARVDITAPATQDNIRDRASGISKAGEESVERARKLGAAQQAAKEAEERAKAKAEKEQQAQLAAAQGAVSTSQEQPSGRKPRQPRQPRKPRG